MLKRNLVFLLLPAILVLVPAVYAPAQQASTSAKPPKFSSDVKVVNLLVTVRDKKGNIVSNLQPNDFNLEDDGRPQTIRYFSPAMDTPLTVGLLVDTGRSQRKALDQKRGACGAFLEQVMRGKDRAFLIHFDHEVELLQDLTSSRDKLEKGLQDLQTDSRSSEMQQTGGRGGQGGQWPPQGGSGPEHHRRSGTMLYDSIFLANDELTSKEKGRKVLVVLSDGEDMASHTSLDGAIEAAQRADTLVYTIYIPGERASEEQRGGFGGPRIGMGGGMGRGPGMGGPGGGGGEERQMRPDGKKTLQRIAKETGGRFFEVSKKNTVEEAYKQIAEDLRNQYSLGYTPDKTSGGYHKIHLTTQKKDFTVQTREGYFAEQLPL